MATLFGNCIFELSLLEVITSRIMNGKLMYLILIISHRRYEVILLAGYHKTVPIRPNGELMFYETL